MIVLVAVAAVALAVWRLNAVSPAAGPATNGSPSAASTTPGMMDDGPDDAPSDEPTSSTPSASTSPSGSPSSSPTNAPAADDSAEAAAALTECRAKVAAADKVIDAADIGAEHWATHVQAQTDFNNGKIDAAELKKLFTRTRLAGPDDLKTYNDAKQAYADTDNASCGKVSDASATTTATLASCKERMGDQKAVLSAGANSMADWKSHQAAMYKSRHQHVENAEQVWVDAWKAAPPHVKAYEVAKADYRDAPSC